MPFASSSKTAGIILFALSVAGCTLNFRVPVSEPVRLTVFQNGKAGADQSPAAADAVRAAANRWLAANPEGWSYAFETRDPRIYVRGKNFYMNVSETEVAVKYCRGFFNCHFWVKQDKRLFIEMKTALDRPD